MRCDSVFDHTGIMYHASTAWRSWFTPFRTVRTVRTAVPMCLCEDETLVSTVSFSVGSLCRVHYYSVPAICIGLRVKRVKR